MEQIIQKPATDVLHSVDQIVVNVKTRQAIVRVTKSTEEGTTVTEKVVFDMLEFLNDEGYSEVQITGVKKMYKQMIAKAWGILESELTDEIMPDSIVEEPIV